ncbi:MAG: caspase family protein [bacterium]
MYSAKYVNPNSQQTMNTWEVSTVTQDIGRDNSSSFKSLPVDNSLPDIIIESPSVSRSLKIVEKTSALRVVGRASAKSGVSSVSINGQEASLDAEGSFWADVLLKVGENRVNVTAIAMNRRKKTETFTVVREAGAAASTEAIAAADKEDPTSLLQLNKGKYHALVIGINSYKYVDKLKTAVNDATTLSSILKDKYGFETTMMLEQQATRESIMNQLNRLRSKLTSEDKLLIYYAGHGVHDKETDASYWLPIDAKRDNDTNWIDAKSITDQLKRITARHVLVVADSCYSGTISRSVDPSLSGNQTRDRFLNKLHSKSARVLISSGGNEPVSDSGGKGHSIFSQVLINSLKSPDKDIFTAEELFVGQIKESVAGRAEQTPEYKVIRNSGHDGGDFVFVKKK